jgi:hypothetical protein
MQMQYHSDPPSRDSYPSPLYCALPVAFSITARDSAVLQNYLKDFQNGNAALHTKIIQKVMAELYQLCPANTSFDKLNVAKVYYFILTCDLTL